MEKSSYTFQLHSSVNVLAPVQYGVLFVPPALAHSETDLRGHTYVNKQ